MLATFYTFTKRKNSTAIPSGESDWHPEILLKEPTDIVNPTLKLGSPYPLETVTAYNYVTFGGRYYFINSWESFRNDIWLAHCTLDYMATYRDYILATSAFVEYDTSANPGIVDTRLSTLAQASYSFSTAAFEPTPFPGGTYILTVTGRGGSVSNFAFASMSDMAQVFDQMKTWVDDVFGEEGDAAAMIKALGKQFLMSGNAPQNLRGCRWVPWLPRGTGSGKVWLGSYDTGVTTQTIDSNPINKSNCSLDIPWQADDWRNSPFCTTLNLFLPYVGVVGFDTTTLIGASSIQIDYAVDFRSGDVAYTVNTDNNIFLGEYAANASCIIPVGISNINPLQVLGSGVSALVNGWAGNGVATLSGVSQTANNIFAPTVNYIGGSGGGAAASLAGNNNFWLWTTFHNTNVQPSSVSSEIGTPTMAVKLLSSVSGFVKTRGVSVAAPCGEQILSVINQTLDRGAFIE